MVNKNKQTLSKNKITLSKNKITLLKNKTIKKNGGNIIKKIFKNGKILMNKQFLKRDDGKYINDYDYPIPETLQKVLFKYNLNNEKFLNLILEKIKENKTFEDLIKTPIKYDNFIKRLKKLIIIKDWSVLDNYFDNVESSSNIHHMHKHINFCLEMSINGLLIILFPIKEYGNSSSLLTKPIQKAYREFYGNE